MLTIPVMIPELIAKATTRKNFRVHFPGGEHADLINDAVLKDSVRFTESVCSETVFRFGCAERSVIEFVAVGCPNIMGAEIECSVEVDTTTLTALQLQAIEAAPGDGTLVAEADSDLGWGYYRIPYGLFVVDSCPRNRSAMARRQVTAYSHSPRRISPVERVRLATWRTSLAPYEDISPKDLIYANLGYFWPSAMAEAGYSRQVWRSWAQIKAAASTVSKSYVSEDENHTYEVQISCKRSQTFIGDQGLYGVEISGWDTSAWDWFAEIYSGDDAPPWPDIPQPVIPIDRRVPRTYLQPMISWDWLDAYTPEWPTTGEHAPSAWLADGGAPVFYAPQRVDLGVPMTTLEFVWDISMRYLIDGVEQSSATFFPEADVSATIYSWHDALNWTNTVRVNATGDVIDLADGKQYRVRYVDAYNMDDLLSAYLELNGALLRTDRRGKVHVHRLTSTPSAITILRSQYEADGLWWDDYSVEPIGRIYYQYRTDDREQDGVWQISDNGSEYDLSENWILQSLSDGSEPSVRAVIETRMLPWLGSVAFLPFSITAHGIPWLTAGDPVNIQTDDPEQPSVASYLLEQSISGVFDLTTDASAASGHRKDEEEL